MGNQCHCLNDPRNQQQEFKIGQGVYSFKKAVCNIILKNIYYIKIILYFIIIVFATNWKWR